MSESNGSEMTLLETRDLTKRFGGLLAVDNLNLRVDKGEILGLIGPNGSGKTTIYNMITGVLPCTRGKVIWKGEDITGLKPHAIAKRGLVRTWQANELFKEMSVFENMLVGHYLHQKVSLIGVFFSSSLSKHDENESKQRAIDALKQWALIDFKDELAKNLPHGHQRALGVLMALSTDPELLLLDEPVTGMNMQEIKTMTNMIKAIRDSGITVVVVEHNVRAVMSLCDRIIVVNEGRKIAEGSPQEIQNNSAVIDVYLGAATEV